MANVEEMLEWMNDDMLEGENFPENGFWWWWISNATVVFFFG